MQKLLKGFLIAAGILAALAVVGVLAINLYVQSAGTQKRIEHALSSALKVPVHLTSTIITPWSGLKASGITVSQVLPVPGDFLEASSFTAHFDWFALASHRLDARDVSLDDPRVTWFQSPGGRWELPRAAPGPQAPPAPGETKAPPHPPWEIDVHHLTVNGASFDFWDDKGIRLAEFAGVQFDCQDPTVSAARGHASARNVSLHDRIFFRDLETNWSFQHGTLQLSSFQTAVGGGQIRGDAQVATQVKHSPFKAGVQFDGVSVSQLLSEAGEAAGQVSGTLGGTLNLAGNSGKVSTINGTAHLELAGGQMRNIEMLELLGQGLQIPDLVEMNLKTARADARIVNGVVNIDNLTFESQNLQLTAHGAIDGGKLALDARLTVNGATAARLPSFVLTYFKPAAAAPDARYIDFQVGNTLTHPKTDLLENILGRRIQSQMNDLFQTIFGNARKHREPEPAATPP